MEKNISFSLLETPKEKKSPSYQELINDLKLKELIKHEYNEMKYVDLEIKYNKLSIKQLINISEYYGIKNIRKKYDLIHEIIVYELDTNHVDIVCKRKKLWNYLQEINEDKYLRKYLIFE